MTSAFEDRLGGPLVRVAGEHDVELRNVARELAGDGEAGVGEGDDDIGLLARANLFDVVAEALHAARVHAAEIGRRLAAAGADVGDAENDRLHALPVDRHRGGKEALAALDVVEVVADDRAVEPRHGPLEDFGAVGRLPIAGNEDVEAEGLERLKDRFALRPRGRPRALEIVAAVDDEARAPAVGALLVDSRL